MKDLFLGAWRYRHFIGASIKSELSGRFARSRLGALWIVIHPLVQAAIFALVLSEVLAARLPGVTSKAGYAVYLMAGLASWGLFSEIVNRCSSVFLEYSGPLKKIAFPRICLPLIVAGGALLNHMLLLCAIALIFALLGHLPGQAWLALPLGMVMIMAFAFGLGILLGVFNVFVRDVGQVTGIVLQLWFWLTPIVYPAAVLPDHLRWVIDINPMAPLVMVYQDALLLNQWPNWESLWVPLVVAAVLGVGALLIFRRASPELVDAL